jgi:hypothetical protein
MDAESYQKIECESDQYLTSEHSVFIGAIQRKIKCIETSNHSKNIVKSFPQTVQLTSIFFCKILEYLSQYYRFVPCLLPPPKEDVRFLDEVCNIVSPDKH